MMYLLLFQSAPEFITHGERGGGGEVGGPSGVSIRPGVHHPGEPSSDRKKRGTRTRFNPPRSSSPRGTWFYLFQHGPIVMFQSAPEFITPGNWRLPTGCRSL